METAALLLLLPVAYLLGAIPLVYLLGRVSGRDVRKEGDLHQALWRYSRPLGLMGILGDMAKGPIPVLAARLLGAEPWLVGAAGVTVVIGQMWPVFLPSTGGKGNTTALLMSLALASGPFGVALAPMLIGLLIRTAARFSAHRRLISGPPSNIFPLGMLAGFSLLPVAAYVMGEPVEVSLALLVLWGAIMLRRLTAGLRADLGLAPGKARVITNRLLYDRSFVEGPPGE